jgi:hypothetical protein
MDNAYDPHSWSRLRREDALREARKRHLLERAEAERERQNLVCATRISALLWLLREKKPVGPQ